MNYLKTICLAAIVAAGLTALAAPASAATLTSPKGTTYTSTIEATSTNIIMHGSFVKVECSHSSGKLVIEQHGSSIAAGGKLSSLTATGCNYVVTVLKPGVASADASGQVMSTGGEVSVMTSVGTCVFTTNNTNVGEGTGGSPAVLDITSAKIPRTGGNFLCGSSGMLTGAYTITTPSTLFLD